jgi:hypothetical protein
MVSKVRTNALVRFAQIPLVLRGSNIGLSGNIESENTPLITDLLLRLWLPGIPFAQRQETAFVGLRD